MHFSMPVGGDDAADLRRDSRAAAHTARAILTGA